MPESPTPTAPVSEPPAAAATTPDATQPPAAAPAAPEAPSGATGSQSSPWDDPAAAKAEIERLRRENAKDRTDAKTQAADNARKELANTIGKALGIVEDGAETDPAKLTESLTASQAEAKQARVELAVFRNAAAAGGDPAALLDSASFLAKVANLDPSDSDALTGAIKAAVEANPRLGVAPADPKAPAPNPAQGSSASGAPAGGQLSEAEVKELYAAGKHEEIVKAEAEGRLNTYLGRQ